MRRLAFILLFLAMTAQAVEPIIIDEPTYPLILVGKIELNYQPPYLWVRFITGNTTSTRIMKYCYKIDPTTPPATTNGWMTMFRYWLGGPWSSNMQPMTVTDQQWCWQ